MNQAAQERTGRENHASCRNISSSLRPHPGAYPCRIHQNVGNGLAPDLEVRLLGQEILNGRAIELAIGLGTGPPHGRPFGEIERPELDPRTIDRPTHDAVQGIDLANQVALAQAADRGVARHLTDRFDPVGQQQGPGAQARSRRCRFTAGVAATDNDDVI